MAAPVRSRGPARDGAVLGVISDTHGLVRPEALAALRGVALIVHAGDVGAPEVLDALAGVAPVVAVRGNNDRGAWARRLPSTRDLVVGASRIHLLHDLHEIHGDPARAGYAAVIAGHSHRPCVERRNGVLYLNPGSAGPRRFSLPIAVARLTVGRTGLRARIIELRVGPASRPRRGAA
jgi:putative phosphoesterase